MTFRRSLVALTLMVALMSVTAGTASASAPAARSMRTRMLHLVNASRRAHGLGALRLNPRLCRSATQHSLRMAHSGSIYHTRNIRRVVRRFRARAWGENVGMTSAYLPAMERAFMGSPEHRANILSRRFHHVGIGVVTHHGRRWVTIDFYG